MSQENVEVVRRAWQAFISGGVEATLEDWTEGVEGPRRSDSRGQANQPGRRVRLILEHESALEAAGLRE